MQAKWDKAIDYYRKAESAAMKANHSDYRAKALVGRAQAEASLRDYGSAAGHAEQAVQLSASLDDKSYLFDALDVSAQILISQGNYNAAGWYYPGRTASFLRDFRKPQPAERRHSRDQCWRYLGIKP